VVAEKCPLCGYGLRSERREVFQTDAHVFDCTNCGCFQLDLVSRTNLPTVAKYGRDSFEILSYAVRRMNTSKPCPELKWELIESILRTTELPSPKELVDNLLLLLAESTQLGERFAISPQTHSAAIGAASPEGFVAAAQALTEKGFVRAASISGGGFDGELTLGGWEASEALLRKRPDSRRAFMAMQYGDPMLNKVFLDCFKPAVEATGFALRRLDEAPPAGLIDDRLRVEIRTSRFLIADLTHHNRGAYWEAGFAEGLGRPVIYACEIGVFEEDGTHFDTSHHHTIVWDVEHLEEAAAALKVTIRATLPSEAILEDQ